MNNSTVRRDLQAPFSITFQKLCASVVVDVEILEGPGGADGIVGIENVHIHEAHGLARADHVTLGKNLRAGDREKIVDVRAAGDGRALLGPGKARGEAGGGVHDGADEAAVDLSVKIAVVGLDLHADQRAVLPALQKLPAAVTDEAHHAVKRGLRYLAVFHVSLSFFSFIPV